MIDHIAFIRKLRNTRADWTYMYNNMPGRFRSVPGEIPYQMGAVVEHLLSAHVPEEGKLVVVSPHVNQSNHTELTILFPEVFFMPVIDASIVQFFNRAIEAQPNLTRKVKTDILYIGCDASGGHHHNHTGRVVPAAWAWASDGVNGSYAVGESGDVTVNIAEYQGLLNAVVSHAEHPANAIHLYSDSSTAVDMFNYDLMEGIIPREARKHGLVSLSKTAMDVLHSRQVTVEWVKGHRNHRLNQIADSLSRLARIRYNAGKSFDDFKRETDALYRTFNLTHQASNM